MGVLSLGDGCAVDCDNHEEEQDKKGMMTTNHNTNIHENMTLKHKQMGLFGKAQLCNITLGQRYSTPVLATDPIDAV